MTDFSLFYKYWILFGHNFNIFIFGSLKQQNLEGLRTLYRPIKAYTRAQEDFYFFYLLCQIINRPGVAGAVLQTASSLTDTVSHSSFVKISSEHLHSQTIKARKLKFWEKVHLPPPVMFHESYVTCHVSPVTFHMSLNFIYFWQSGEASRWRVYYQWGLPRLVFLIIRLLYHRFPCLATCTLNC